MGARLSPGLWTDLGRFTAKQSMAKGSPWTVSTQSSVPNRASAQNFRSESKSWEHEANSQT